MWMTWILSNWRTVLLVTVIVSSLAYGTMMKLQRDLARAQRDKHAETIKALNAAAKTYADQSAKTAKETSDAFTKLVEQIKDKDVAIRNAKARFGSCNVARGLGPVGVLPTEYGAGQAGIPESTGGVQESERLAVSSEFVNGCATDAAFVQSVQEWRVKNDLPISKE